MRFLVSSLYLSHHQILSRLIFDDSPDNNIQSRANAIKSGLPNAIFRQAQQAPGGATAVFQNPTGFLGYTQQIYVCHHSFLLDGTRLDVGL